MLTEHWCFVWDDSSGATLQRRLLEGGTEIGGLQEGPSIHDGQNTDCGQAHGSHPVGIFYAPQGGSREPERGTGSPQCNPRLFGPAMAG